MAEFLLVCGGVICLIVPIVLFGILPLVDTLRGRNAHSRLSESGDYQLLHDAPRAVNKIFGGEAQGKGFAFRPSAERYTSYNSGGRTRTMVHFHLQIIMPIYNQNLSGLVLSQTRKLNSITETFNEIWKAKPSADLLSIDQQSALVRFVAEKTHPSGIYGGRIKFRSFMRQLNIIDRSKWSQSLPAEIFPDATAVLVYDHPKANIDLQTFESLLDELLNLSIVLEDSSQK